MEPIEVAGMSGETEGSLPPMAGVPNSQQLCARIWDDRQVAKFGTLVGLDYGYRLFLDDLPSATIQGDKPHYEWTIPLGFIPETGD